MMPIDQAIKDLQFFQNAQKMEPEEFDNAHKRMQEIGPSIKAIVETMDAEQKKKYNKKAEKKVMQ